VNDITVFESYFNITVFFFPNIQVLKRVNVYQFNFFFFISSHPPLLLFIAYLFISQYMSASKVTAFVLFV